MILNSIWWLAQTLEEIGKLFRDAADSLFTYVEQKEKKERERE